MLVSAQILSDAESSFLQLVGFTHTANNRLLAPFSFADRLAETLRRFRSRQYTRLEYFAVKPADEVLVCLVAVFTCYLNHTRNILPEVLQRYNLHTQHPAFDGAATVPFIDA